MQLESQQVVTFRPRFTMTDRIRLTMLSGSFECDSADSLTVLDGYLRENARILDSRLIAYQSEDDDPSLRPLEEETDLLLVFTQRLSTAGAELERLKRYCAAGKPVVGIRTASHGFRHWLGFGPEILGGSCDGHHGAGPVCHVEKVAADDAILSDVLPFDSPGSLYRTQPLAADATVLLRGRTDEAVEPVAWKRILGSGARVFCTSLGHQRDFWELDFLRLLENALLWAAGQTPPERPRLQSDGVR